MFNNVLFYLPSEANRVIVTTGFHPDAPGSTLPRILCSIPMQKRTIQVSHQHQSTQEIFSPDLLWSQVMHSCRRYHRAYGPNGHNNGCAACKADSYRCSYNIFTYRVTDKGLETAPYELANVEANGRICWGYGKYGYTPPLNLRDAHNYFWGSLFSSSLFGPYSAYMVTQNRNPRFETHLETYFTPEKNHIRLWNRLVLPERCIGSGQREDAVFISSRPELLEQFPDAADRLALEETIYPTDPKDSPQVIKTSVVVGFANFVEDGAEVEIRIGKKTIRLPLAQVTLALEKHRQSAAMNPEVVKPEIVTKPEIVITIK